MFSCDYNGWTDVPEEEREALEAFEAAWKAPVEPPATLPARVPDLPACGAALRKAA